MAEDCVFAVEPWGAFFGLDDEELAAAGVRSAVGHGNGAVLMSEFFGEFVFDGGSWAFVAVAAGAVAVFEVAGLDHEVFDDAVKWYAVVFAFLGEGEEVFDGFGRFVVVKFHCNVALRCFEGDGGVASGEHED